MNSMFPRVMACCFALIALLASGCDLIGDVEDASDGMDMGQCLSPSDATLCTSMGLACGTQQTTDPCGIVREVDCGQCPTNNNDPCTPEPAIAFCDRMPGSCGMVTGLDNCGTERTEMCGTCPNGDECVDGSCACMGESAEVLCAIAERECNALTTTDSCGAERMVRCGDCEEGVCLPDGKCSVCKPLTDEALCGREGAQCGMVTVTDNCGDERTVDCTAARGGCTGLDACQRDNTCACPQESVQEFCQRQIAGGADCGADVTGLDNCGNRRTERCSLGVCDASESCQANVCTCDEVSCQANSCGMVTNACRNTRD